MEGIYTYRNRQKGQEGKLRSKMPGHKIQDKMRIIVFKSVGKKEDFGYYV